MKYFVSSSFGKDSMTNEKNVKRGCLDCADRHTDLKKEPCKSCVRWSKWREKECQKGKN